MPRLSFAAALVGFAAASAGGAGPVLAGAAEDPPSTAEIARDGQDLTPEQWRALTDGRTVWYRIDDHLWGREHYDRPGHVTFQFPDGECLEADWTYSEPWFCFDFGPALGGGPPHCFRHIRFQDRLWALSRNGQPQEIERIDASPVACGTNPTS